jgi:hypothetical protein
MQYALVHNDRIQVGPRTWNRNFFLEYIEENELDSSALPRYAPKESTITDTWKLLLITEVNFPELQEPFEQLVGPFWTIHEDHITGLYNKTDLPIHMIQGSLKNTVATNRYAVETGKLEYTFADGQVVELYTEREERMIYLNTLQALPDGMTVSFKFKNGVFRTGVTKTELQEIVNLGMMHIASAFEWEAGKVSDIETAGTIEELKMIELRHPTQIPEESKDGSTTD